MSTDDQEAPRMPQPHTVTFHFGGQPIGPDVAAATTAAVPAALAALREVLPAVAAGDADTGAAVLSRYFDDDDPAARVNAILSMQLSLASSGIRDQAQPAADETYSWAPARQSAAHTKSDGGGLVAVEVAGHPRQPELLSGSPSGAVAAEHWGQRQIAAAQVRNDVASLARAAGLSSCAHLTVGLIWAPGDRRRRDEDNLWPTLKVCADALSKGRADWIGLQLVPDDTPRYVTKLTPMIVPPPLRGLWLLVDPQHQTPVGGTDG